jgi:formate hydrogenlyase subunit 3/multisubunit Na+/H+ antiporter MnhD subunit
MAELLPLLILVPFTASLLCLLARFLRRLLLAQIVASLSVAGIFLLLGFLFPVFHTRGVLTYSMGGWAEPLGIALHLDGLAWTASVMGTVIGFCALLFSFGERSYRSDFYFFLLMLVAGMEGVVLTGDLFNMFVFIEIVSISSYLLIAYSLNPHNLWASLRYLLQSSLSIALFLVGLFLVYRLTGTFSLRLISQGLSSAGGAGSMAPGTARALGLAAAALTVGVGLKAAFVPLHSWLPDAHAAAPHPVSALLSGVMIKISFLAVWRILTALGTTGLQALFRWIGPLTALLAVGLALSQTDSKRLLAFHSVSQMGLIIAAYGAAPGAGAAALSASLAHVLSHSLFKSLLFLSVGAAIHLTGERDLERGPERGISPPPWLMIFFLVGALSISGLPPFNGYVSKILVVSLFKTSPLLGTALRLTAIGTAASMIKLSGFFRRTRLPRQSGTASLPSSPQAVNTRLSPYFLVALTLLALLCLASGLVPRFLMESLVFPAVGASELRFSPVYTAGHLIESAVYALLGVGLYLIVRTRRVRRVLLGIRGVRLSLDGALLLVVAAVVLFALLGGVLGAALPGGICSVLFSR